MYIGREETHCGQDAWIKRNLEESTNQETCAGKYQKKNCLAYSESLYVGGPELSNAMTKGRKVVEADQMPTEAHASR